MSNNMLRVAGTRENGQAIGFKTDDVGRISITHKRSAECVTIFNRIELRDGNAVWSDKVDISHFALCSLRISNTHNQPVNFIFAYDALNTDTTTYLKNYGGSNLGFTVPANSGVRLITPEEFPFLQYLQNIKIRIQCPDAPDSGYLTVIVAGRY